MQTSISTHESFPKARIALLAILALAFFIRSFALDASPPALNSDELLKAFDGASVYRTGRDHHGHAWPLFFKQSGEYSPPLYIYFAGLFSAPFGIGPYTTRLPSAMLGTLSVLAAYLLMRRWAGEGAGMLAAVLVALSPWNLHFSRMGWEAISLIPLQLLALWCFERWRSGGRNADIVLSAALFALTLYAYPTARLSTPILLCVLAALYHRVLIDRFRQTCAAVGVFAILSLPLMWAILSNAEAMQARWRFVSIFNRPDWLSLAATHYAQHLSPGFLFIHGDANPLHGLAGGVVLAALAPFCLIGLGRILIERRPEQLLLLAWLFTFAIPACLTYDQFNPRAMPNALRSAGGMPLFELIAVWGALTVWARLRIEIARKTGAMLFAGAIALNAAWVCHDALTRYPMRSATDWQVGLAELVRELEARKGEYDRVVVSHNVRLHPVALAVFADKTPGPLSGEDFSEYVLPFFHYVPVYGDFGHDAYLRSGGVELGSVQRWFHLASGKNLLAAQAGEIDGAEPIGTIRCPDGRVAYELYATQR